METDRAMVASEEIAMELRKVTAIIRSEALENVEKRLQEVGVKGISVTRVKGYGEYADFFARDWLVTHVRIEIFTEKAKAEEVAAAIMGTAHTGLPGDGIVVILPVEKIFRIRSQSEVRPDEV